MFAKALNEKNLNQLYDLYSEDCVMVLGSGKKISGKKAIRKVFKLWVDSVVNIKVKTA